MSTQGFSFRASSENKVKRYDMESGGRLLNHYWNNCVERTGSYVLQRVSRKQQQQHTVSSNAITPQTYQRIKLSEKHRMHIEFERPAPGTIEEQKGAKRNDERGGGGAMKGST